MFYFLELFHDGIQIKNNPRWGKKQRSDRYSQTFWFV